MSTPRRPETPPPTPVGGEAPSRCFLFVGDAGSCLGGMQDYYGAYDDVAAARRAVPEDVRWAEVAVVRDGRLEVIATGERLDRRWRWDDLDALDAPEAAGTPGVLRSAA